MTDKELRKLRRSDLLEMLIEVEKMKETLLLENQELRRQLESKEIKLAEAGSIAEAAMRLNGIFEAAQKAADQYLENIQRMDQGKQGAEECL